MPNRNTEVAPGVRAPVLSAALLARIHELNRDYIELLLGQHSKLAAGCHAAAPCLESLPAKVLDALGQMSFAARRALAATPFALCSLGFEDRQFWSAALNEVGQNISKQNNSKQGHAGQQAASVEARYGVLDTVATPAAFCEITLLLAWHTAMSNRVAARVLFALPDTLATALVAAPLWRLRRIALDYPGVLTPRWPANAAFWPDLIRFAAAADSRRLETAQLLGNQLIAAELEGLEPRSGKRLGTTRLRFPMQ